jgi:hypothetical protein
MALAFIAPYMEAKFSREYSRFNTSHSTDLLKLEIVRTHLKIP